MTSAKSVSTENRLNDLIARCGPVDTDLSIPDISTTGNKALTVLTIPGGTVQGGEEYTGKAVGSFSTSAIPGSATFTVYQDGVGSATLGSLSVPAAGLWNGAANAGWRVYFEVFYISSTEAWVYIEVAWHTAAGAGGSARWFATQDNTVGSTDTDKDLTLAFGFTGSGLTLHTGPAKIERRG